MFESRFEKPLQIPAQSVLAQNSPTAQSAAMAETAALDMPADEPPAKDPAGSHAPAERPND
jgi:hypothetical protein